MISNNIKDAHKEAWHFKPECYESPENNIYLIGMLNNGQNIIRLIFSPIENGNGFLQIGNFSTGKMMTLASINSERKQIVTSIDEGMAYGSTYKLPSTMPATDSEFAHDKFYELVKRIDAEIDRLDDVKIAKLNEEEIDFESDKRFS